MPLGRIQLFRPPVEGDRKKTLQFFSSLGETLFHKRVKPLQILRHGGATGESENGGVNLRAGVEDLRRKLADLFNFEDRLQQDGDGTVGGGSGKGGVAVGHLFLQGDDDCGRRWGSKGELDEEGGGDGVGKISANARPGWVLGEGFQRIPFDQPKTALVLKLLPQPSRQAVVDFKGFDRVTYREEGTRQGTQARTDLLDGFGRGFGQGMGNDRGEGGFGQEVLAQLAKGT